MLNLLIHLDSEALKHLIVGKGEKFLLLKFWWA